MASWTTAPTPVQLPRTVFYRRIRAYRRLRRRS
jgi:hypothetical protein